MQFGKQISRIFSGFLLCMIVSLLSGPGGLQSAAVAQTTEIRIIYYSNMPDISGERGRPGIAHITTFLREQRQNYANTLFLHGGDSLAPSILSSLDRGAHVIDLLNVIEPDAMAVSKREFSYGEDVLVMRAGEAVFPMLSANTRDKATGKPFPYIDPSVIINVAGLRVGIMALTTSSTAQTYLATETEFLSTSATMESEAAALREQGADIVIAMYDATSSRLTSLIEGGKIDLILQTSNFATSSPESAARTRIVPHASGAGYLSTIDIAVDPTVDQRVRVVGLQQSINAGEYEPDPEIQLLISEYLEPLNQLLDMKLAIIETPLDTRLEAARGHENAFANMVADAIREAEGADVAIINGGGIRGGRQYPAGTSFARRELQVELPFRNTVVSLNVSGKQLLQAVEFGIDCMSHLWGCGAHLSNMKVVFDPDRPEGERILSATIGGVPVDPEKTYKLATADFIAKGGDGYDMFAGDVSVENLVRGHLVWEVVSDYLRERGSVSPKIEGRLKAKRSLVSDSK